MVGVILRGTIVNRTYGTLKNLYIYLFFLTMFGPIYFVWSSVIVVVVSRFAVVFTVIVISPFLLPVFCDLVSVLS